MKFLKVLCLKTIEECEDCEDYVLLKTALEDSKSDSCMSECTGVEMYIKNVNILV